MVKTTVKEFNEKYGHSTYRQNVYKIASDEDIGTFVCMELAGLRLPYFCHWEQEATYEKLPQGKEWGYYHEIVAEAS